MLGILRFALALAVAFSHMGLTPNFHFGAMSVMVFYLIAGYVMTYSFRVNFDNSLLNIRRFYVDRFFRIYPLYILSLLIIFFFVRATGYGRLYLDAKSMVANLTLFPLNVHPTIMNPATWSLGTEVQFYVLLPFLVRFPRLKYSLLPLSYIIFALASFGVMDSVAWAYKLLPGTLFLFIVGSVIFDLRSDPTPVSRRIVFAMLGVGIIHLGLLAFFPAHINQPYAFEALCGLLGGSLCLYVLGDAQAKHRELDAWLGKLSYPLFISHVCVLYLFDHLQATGVFVPSLRGAVALQLMTAVALSYPLALVDDYFQALRKRIQVRGVEPVVVVTAS